VVAAVRAKQAQRDAMMAAHMPNLDAGADAGGAAADWSKKRLERLTMQLGLDAGQQKAVSAILPKDDWMNPATMDAQRKEGEKRMDGVLTAFDNATFDAKKVDLSGAPGKSKHEALEKDAAFLSQLLPLLTPDQREKLAGQRERQGMRRPPMGGFGGASMGGPGMGGPGMGGGPGGPGGGGPGGGGPGGGGH
jgi:hypothetical protein